MRQLVIERYPKVQAVIKRDFLRREKLHHPFIIRKEKISDPFNNGQRRARGSIARVADSDMLPAAGIVQVDPPELTIDWHHEIAVEPGSIGTGQR